jgi:hypothetical protein
MTITYCKGLPTYPEEMNALGQTNFELFLQSFSKIFHQATCETLNHLLQVPQFDKSKWNSYLQQKYQINKRHANSVINFASGKVDSSSECRKNHLKRHFYKKENKWCIAVQFTPLPVVRLSSDSASGCIGIDLNPGSIGWAYIDREGNLKAHGQIPLLQGLPSGKQEAQIVAACLELVALAKHFVCPIIC